MKVKDILKKEANNLKNNNIEDEILKSRILLGYILNLKSEELIFHIEDEVSEDNLLKYTTILDNITKAAQKEDKKNVCRKRV